MNSRFNNYIEESLKLDFNKDVKSASEKQLYCAVGKAYNAYCNDMYAYDSETKRACYFSAEFLTGKLLKSNLFNCGLLKVTEKYLNDNGRSLNEFENFDDPALGNGGLGRLAACFLDSAATCGIPLDGYGIRYRYGYFRQVIENKMQKEEADKWLEFYDAFGVEEKEKYVEVCYNGLKVKAIPYIYYIPGFKKNKINKLVLFDSQPFNDFCYKTFDEGDYVNAYCEAITAWTISASLYPNDNTCQGKKLRLMQQYFFSSASLQYIIKNLIESGKSADNIENYITIQLNDTHPVISIAEFIRLMINLGLSFESAFQKAKCIFAYTNHTVLNEALEKWEVDLFSKMLPDVFSIITMIEDRLEKEFGEKLRNDMKIISDNKIHMANLACYVSKSINGVAKIHSDIIKKSTLNSWFSAYPERFNNKTNGVTQRRWLFMANPELFTLLKEITHNEIEKDFSKIKMLENFAGDETVLTRFLKIREENKNKLCEYIAQKESITLDSNAVFVVQIKRLHEYKRQLMNILSIIALYFRIKEGRLKDFPKTVFIFGAKSAPGYYMAKRIIELICSAAAVINSDKSINGLIKVVFVTNYDVSYAEKIIPAADISEQISLAGKEASGTSNMKFMMNGSVTLGTLDGANIEIVENAGKENNYIFGLTEEEAEKLSAKYEPMKEYKNNPEIKKVLDTLKNKDFYSGNIFEDIFKSLTEEDKYFVLKDFPEYLETKIRAIKDTENKKEFMKKCLINTANSAGFSSDRTIKEYADEIWFR